MSLSKTSRTRLATCHPDIVVLTEAVAEDEDVIVIEGARTLERQKQLIKEGKSSLKKPENGKHIVTPEKPLSDAIDMAPAPLDWKDTKRFYSFGEKVLKKARELKDAGLITSEFRWGGDWDRDGDYTDQKFFDLVHFERV